MGSLTLGKCEKRVSGPQEYKESADKIVLHLNGLVRSNCIKNAGGLVLRLLELCTWNLNA